MPVSQRIFAGHAPQPLQPAPVPASYRRPAPAGAECVEMQENTQVMEDGRARLSRLRAGRTFDPQGQETRKGEQVMNAGTRLGPIELGLAATLGHARLEVVRKVSGGMSTGDELVEPGCRWGPAKSQQQSSATGQLVAAPGVRGGRCRHPAG